MNWLLALYPGDEIALLVLTAIVQVAVIVGLASVLSRTLGRRNPAALYGVWLCALVCIPAGTLGIWAFSHSGVTLIALPVLSPESETAPADSLVAGAAASAVAPAAAANDPSAANGVAAQLGLVWRSVGRFAASADTWRGAFVVAGAAWICGMVFFLARLIFGLHLLEQLKRELQPADMRSLGELAERIRRALRMREFPRMMISHRVASPISLGIFRPTIVMPAGLLESLDPRQLQDVLVHECAHFLKRDHATGMLEQVLRIVFWPHPAMYVLSRELDRAREELCDNYVLRSGSVPEYARTLLLVSQRAGQVRPTYSAAIGFLQGPRPLEVRVRSLLDKRRKLVTRMNRVAFVALAVAFSLTAVTVAGTRLVPAPRPQVPLTPELALAEMPSAPLEPAAAMTEPLAAPTSAQSVDRSMLVRLPAAPIMAAALSDEAPPLPQLPSLVAEQASASPRLPARVEPKLEKVMATLARAASLPKAAHLPRSFRPAESASDAAMVAMGTAAYADVSAQLQPAVRIEPEDGVYWVTLRLGDESSSPLMVEPGTPRTVVYEESLTSRVALELTVDPEPGSSDAVKVTYRLTVQVDPQIVAHWEASGAAARLRHWTLLVPAFTATASDVAGPSVPSENSLSVDARIARLREVRRLLAAALRLLGND